jgi:Calcineurin-like phosphoesterase
MPSGHSHPLHFAHPPNTQPVAPNRATHGTIGKVRRGPDDPVAAPKDTLPYEPPPPTNLTNLLLPFEVVNPTVSAAAQSANKLVFHCVGDTGGIHGTATQEAIAKAMEDQFSKVAAGEKPAFFYNLGDVIYFNGQSQNYTAEFYEPYQYYPALIFAIPGNHDGDTHTRPGDQPDTEPSLYGFMQNFCDSAPHHVSPYRLSMTQPYVYWTLDAPLVTIIGLYSNIGGSLDARGTSEQQQWLQDQVKKAPTDKKLLIAVHHPPYSLDSAHGGCPDILAALDRAFVAANRAPDAVLSGHVHNYQRFSRKLANRDVPYIVAGAGGYANDARSMHKLQKGLPNKLPFPTKLPDVRLMNYNEEEPGFLRLTVTPEGITFEYFIVPFDDSGVKLFDTATA